MRSILTPLILTAAISTTPGGDPYPEDEDVEELTNILRATSIQPHEQDRIRNAEIEGLRSQLKKSIGKRKKLDEEDYGHTEKKQKTE